MLSTSPADQPMKIWSLAPYSKYTWWPGNCLLPYLLCSYYGQIIQIQRYIDMCSYFLPPDSIIISLFSLKNSITIIWSCQSNNPQLPASFLWCLCMLVWCLCMLVWYLCVMCVHACVILLPACVMSLHACAMFFMLECCLCVMSLHAIVIFFFMLMWCLCKLVWCLPCVMSLHAIVIFFSCLRDVCVSLWDVFHAFVMFSMLVWCFSCLCDVFVWSFVHTCFMSVHACMVSLRLGHPLVCFLNFALKIYLGL